MTNPESIGVIGAGPFGTALAQVLAKAGRRVMLMSQAREVVAEINERHTNEQRMPGLKLARAIAATNSPKELANDCRFLVLAVAASDVRDRARRIGEHLDGSHIVVHAIGAFADPEEREVSSVLADEVPTRRLGALAGPASASDLIDGHVCSMVCASPFEEVTREARRLLSCPPTLRVYESRDRVGVELASALSGAYTLALGLADGLEVGVGTRAVLITRIVAEGSRVMGAIGADANTFAGLAGLGNLLVRGGDSGGSSPEYRYGIALARGVDAGATPVGAQSTPTLARVAQRAGQYTPVLEALARILAGEIDARSAAAAIADRVARVE